MTLPRLTDDWLKCSATQRVLALLTDAGYQAFVVGGCVRNALLGVAVHDVDVATNARPDAVLALAAKAGLKAVPTGIDHGTVTVVSNGTGYEVTTYRDDVETDGRHATVRFSDSVVEDARRRDFTMNALYASADGSVIDPLNGLPDILSRTVRFIEDPARRIEEDYLRILRFFRFSAWYGDPGQWFDAEALSAIASHLDGLVSLSRERVGAELLKIFAAPDPAPALAAMQTVGVLGRCLPGADVERLALLVHMELTNGVAPDPLRRMAVIGAFDGAALRLSRTQKRQLGQYQTLIGSSHTAAALGYLIGKSLAQDVLLLRAAMFEQSLDEHVFEDVQTGADAVFPVSAADLIPRFTGQELGQKLDLLEQRWITSNFTLTREDLLT
jgi:poly(A) polymerase